MAAQKRSQFKLLNITLIRRQEIWLPTVWGWLFLGLLTLTLLTVSISNLPSFLAVNQPVNAEVLVIEGWLPDYAVKEALARFKRGSYRQIVTTGIPIERGCYLAEYKNYAELAAATLKTLGLESEKIVPVPTPEVRKDRTYASAIAFKQWLEKANIPIKSIDLLTLDLHARRSWLLYRQALASTNIKVGIIAMPPIDYDPKYWWRYSAGVRKTINELVAYIYARFINWNT
ncbi:ElyC/SanA/YdcF family protein [Chroococcidiopsis sp.]|uniref:ElyC/SanA/YdcF family protein n=1 Tax=Chroococcidiopsis sp. TaxID=3088168 RepID=UPI003F3AFBC3